MDSELRSVLQAHGSDEDQGTQSAEEASSLTRPLLSQARTSLSWGSDGGVSGTGDVNGFGMATTKSTVRRTTKGSAAPTMMGRKYVRRRYNLKKRQRRQVWRGRVAGYCLSKVLPSTY